MPITSSALKKQRVDKRKTARNKRARSQYKSAVNKALTQPTGENITSAYSQLDRAAKKNIIKKEKAGRIKARIVRKAKSASNSSPFGKKVK